MSTQTPSARAPREHDPSLLKLSDTEAEFFKQQTGIKDDEELRKHILQVQAEAMKVNPYGCIVAFYFTRLEISSLPFYDEFLKIVKTKPGCLFLDFACCFGNDARKAIADGYPIENVIASDLEPGFWDLGHALFKSSPETFPVPFIPGDVFSSALISPRAPYYKSDTALPPLPSLKELTSLTPLQGHITFIHASRFFHLFNAEQQTFVARALGSLLSPEPGSTIFGIHASSGSAGNVSYRDKEFYSHSPESWTELWDGGVYEKGSVKVETMLKQIDFEGLGYMGLNGNKFYWLAWSITRL